MKTIFNGDCLEMLDHLKSVPLIIADPPDNLGLTYDTYVDVRKDYYQWLELVVRKALRVTDCLWLSYYFAHDLEIKNFIRNIIKFERPSVKAKTFIWRFTFGQYNDKDCGSGFRFLLRLMKPTARLNVDSIRVPSKRMELGDSRASGPRVPDDVWEFPRIQGNNSERRSFHPTQHPEDLYRRMILLNSNPEDLVVDLFGGTGTLLRVAPPIGRKALISEISEGYSQHIFSEHRDSKIITDPTQLVTVC